MNAPSSLRPIDFIWTHHLSDFVTAAAWSPDNTRLAAASVAGELSLLEARHGLVQHALPQVHADGIDALAWHPDSTLLATAGRDGAWRLWDATTGKMRVEQKPGALWVEFAAWSPQPIGDHGSLLAIGAGNQVTLWNRLGEPIGEPLKFPKTIADLAWILGTTLAVATSTSITLHDRLTGATERMFAAKDPVLRMSFSPNGKWLMTGTQDCAVHVWNCDNSGEMHMRGYASKVRELVWHKGSRWLAAGGGEVIAVWDCSGRGPEGRTPTLLEWHHDQVTSLQYQHGGDWLASGARDGGIAVWSPTQRQQLLSGAKISSEVTRVLWAPNDKHLAVTGAGGEVQVLQVG